jgi:hypothetical protein
LGVERLLCSLQYLLLSVVLVDSTNLNSSLKALSLPGGPATAGGALPKPGLKVEAVRQYPGELWQ